MSNEGSLLGDGVDVSVLVLWQDVAGAEIRASVGGSYDSNLFEQGVNPQGGWINRISVMSKGVPFQS